MAELPLLGIRGRLCPAHGAAISVNTAGTAARCGQGCITAVLKPWAASLNGHAPPSADSAGPERIADEPEPEAAERMTRNGTSGANRGTRSTRTDDVRAEIHRDPRHAYQAVLGAELAAKSGTKELIAPCPLHDDARPSLRVNLDKAAWFCDPCGRGGDLFALAQAVWGLDFPKSAERLAVLLDIGSRKPSQTGKQVVRRMEYQIRDLDGSLKATHHRIEYSDGSKDMPWEPKGIQPRGLPLFQIEKTVDSADGETVLLTEGEKPAASLWERRWLAVGTVCGADQHGTKVHDDESLRPLVRFNIVLWPDNDDSGRAHMRSHGAALVRLGCQSVRWLSWPEAPAKGDAADFAGSDEELSTLIESAQPASGEQAERRQGGPHPTDDLPQNLAAERSVLGAVLRDNEAYSELAARLKAEHFHHKAHRDIWNMMGALRLREEPIDSVTLTHALRLKGQLDAMGGAEYIAKLAELVPSAQNVQHHARIVGEMAVKRDIIAGSTQLASYARNGVSADALIGEVARWASTLAPYDPSGDRYPDRLAVDAYEVYQRMLAEKREYALEGLIRYGSTALLTGLMEAGKSTFARQLCRSWATGEPFLGRSVQISKTLVIVSAKEYDAWAETIGRWGLQGVIYLIKSESVHFRNGHEAVKYFDYRMKGFGCKSFVLDTLFDFFGLPDNNSGDQNRIVMNEQEPLLELVQEQRYAGLCLGHAPKSEAKAVDPRDPQESFAGHTGWSAQHRMRMALRRKAQGVISFITGKGSPGDKGFEEEQIIEYDEETRLISLGGAFKDHIGRVAMPSVIEALRGFGTPKGMKALVDDLQKGEKWVRAGLRAARNEDPPKILKDGNGRATKYYLPEWKKPSEQQTNLDDTGRW